VYGPAPTSSTSAATSPDPSPSPGADRGWAAGPLPPSAAPTAIVSLLIKARNIRFDTDHLEAPAGRAFVLEFDNDDPGIPHNVDINDATGASVFKGAIHIGPSEALYEVPALAAGSYTFHCDVHPTMRGTLTVN
jgi:plastocyanin